MPLNILGYNTLTNIRQLTRHNLGYRLNPFPHSVISNLALVVCRSSVFEVHVAARVVAAQRGTRRTYLRRRGSRTTG